MPNWIKIGRERVIPSTEPDIPDDSEFVPYEKLAGLELDINDMASASERRELEVMLNNLGQSKPLSPSVALDWEVTFQTVYSKFILAVKDTETGKEKTGAEKDRFLDNECDWDDAVAILTTIRRHLTLAQSKKKSWRLQFGSHTT